MTRITTPNSGNLYAVGYDLPSKVLSIQFKSKTGEPGAVYNYHNVEHEHYSNLMTAESPGRYFHAKIRDQFPTEKEEQASE